MAGVDEVGRGAWAGPVSVGVAVLSSELVDGHGDESPLAQVRDSKQLSEAARESLFEPLAACCRAWAVGHASHADCDALGMSGAQQLAASRALASISTDYGCDPDALLVDGVSDFLKDPRSVMVVGGDAACLSVSVASVLAKVTRDRMMRAEDQHFPAYDFVHNKGYAAPRHRMALAAWGASTIHRRSWAFMETWCPLGRSSGRPPPASSRQLLGPRRSEVDG